MQGREAERSVVDALLRDARQGQSGSIVIEGEAGIGKTLLCRYGLETAADFTILQASAVESEADLPCAGLSELLRPLLDLLEDLPERQRAPLAGALALGPAAPADRFALGAAVLSLLAAGSGTQPVLAVVDDAHWLDVTSADALTFAARRLDREGVVLLFAARTADEPSPAFAGLPRLCLRGLDTDAATRMVSEARGVAVPSIVAAKLVAGTGGNPLALRELACALQLQALAGDAPLPDPLPVGERVGEAFARDLANLPEPVQRALTVLAASDSAGLSQVLPALTALDARADALELAEDAGIIELKGDSATFVHPLLRAAAYERASPSARREAHRALAGAAATVGEHERETWHLAAAAIGPDEKIAAALERVAGKAWEVGGATASAPGMERAALLTPAGRDRARRLVAAAGALLQAGRPQLVSSYLDEALAMTHDPLLRADAARVRGQLVTLTHSPIDGYRILSDAARDVEAHDPARAALLWYAAGLPAAMDGEMEAAVGAGRETYRLAQELGDRSIERLAVTLLSMALLTLGRTAEGTAILDEFDPHFESDIPGMQPTNAQCLTWIERYDLARPAVDEAVAGARARGDLASLPFSLSVRSELQFYTGAWSAALAAASEAVRLAEETGQTAMLGWALCCLARVEAGRGAADDCRRHAAAALELVGVGATGRLVDLYVGSVLGLLALSLGKHDEAAVVLVPLERLSVDLGVHEPSVFGFGADLVEALARAGRDDAFDALKWFEADAERTERVWAKAAALRCRALLAPHDEADDLYAAAMSLHQKTAKPFERARTALCWGESLRRHHRQREASTKLREALATFERLGATPWAKRASRELRATGQRVARDSPSRTTQLTAQEFLVALAVAQGASNKEAAAELFLSPKTVEFHLGGVYRKLEIHSRTQLVRLFAAELSIPS